MNQNQILTTDDTARELNLCAGTLRNWACNRNGLLTPVRIGRRLGWRRADIDQLLEHGKTYEVKS